MSTEKMRESFEAWAITSAWLGLVGDDLEFIDGGYVYPEVQSAWLSWQASRAAIEVELPVPYESFSGVFHAEDGEDPDLSMSAHEVRQAIESLGLKVKPW